MTDEIVKLQKMNNKSHHNKIKKIKTNQHIPNIAEIFSCSSNKAIWWLPLSINNKTPFKKDTSQQAKKWANE